MQQDQTYAAGSSLGVVAREEGPRTRTPEHARSAGARAPGEFHSPGEVNTLTSINSSSPITPSSEGGGGGESEEEKSSSFSTWVETTLGYSLETEEGLAKLDDEPDLALWLSGLMVSHGKLPPKNRNSALTYAKKLLGLANQDEVKLRHNVELLVSASPDGRHLGYYLGIANREAPGWLLPGEEDVVAKAARKRREREAKRTLREHTISDHVRRELQDMHSSSDDGIACQPDDGAGPVVKRGTEGTPQGMDALLEQLEKNAQQQGGAS